MQTPDDRSVRVRNTLLAVTLGAVALVVLVVLAWEPISGWLAAREGPPGPPAGTGAVGQPEAVRPGGLEAGEKAGRPAGGWPGLPGLDFEWPAQAATAAAVLAPADCSRALAGFERVCAVLDREAGLADGCGLLRGALADLGRRPPPAVSGLGDPAALVAGTVHLFRVLGRDRVDRLRALLGEHPELAEPLALAGAHQAACAPPAERPGLEQAYRYAAFAFTTVGGQAYLRRRAPSIEALACFWGLVALERARAAGHDPAGVDPRPEIARCAELIEGSKLRYRDRYRAELERLRGEWASRGAAGD